MKKFLLSALTVLVLSCGAFAWPACSGQWVSVPKGTTSGTLYSTGDLLFQCQPKTSTPDPSNSTSNSSSNSNATSTSGSTSSSNSSSSSNQKQSQSQGQNQTATGGSASASNGDQSNAQSTSFNSNYTEVRQTPMAYAPEAIPSAPCRSGFSGGGSTGLGALSFGGSKRDDECDLRETARAFALLGNQEAAARVLCETKGAKKAKLNQEACLKLTQRIIPVAPPVVIPPQPLPQAIVVPAPVVTINAEIKLPQPAEYHTAIDVVAPKQRTCSITKGTVHAKVKQRKPCPAN